MSFDDKKVDAADKYMVHHGHAYASNFFGDDLPPNVGPHQVLQQQTKLSLDQVRL